jgi:hypothetical protein
MKQVWCRSRLTSLCALALMFAVCASNMISMSHSSNQNPRFLTLRGRIIEGGIIDDGSDSVKVTMKLNIEIKNTGSKPALILEQEPLIVDRTIVATPSDATKDTYLFRLQSLPSNGRSPEWEELQKHVDKRVPPSDLIRKLAPNETWTFELTEWFYIGKETNIDPNSKPWSVVRQASRMSQQITLQLWSRDIESNADRKQLRFSKMLQSRWQKFGELQLENLTSEPIPIDFSAFTVNSNHN